MSFTEHPSNHINKGLDALGGWKEIWISLWCIILTHVLTWALGTEDSCAQKEDLGPFCNKHSRMGLLRWIPSYFEINFKTYACTHTHSNRWQRVESGWMQWTNYNCCSPDQKNCVWSWSDPANCWILSESQQDLTEVWWTTSKENVSVAPDSEGSNARQRGKAREG